MKKFVHNYKQICIRFSKCRKIIFLIGAVIFLMVFIQINEILEYINNNIVYINKQFWLPIYKIRKHKYLLTTNLYKNETYNKTNIVNSLKIKNIIIILLIPA